MDGNTSIGQGGVRPCAAPLGERPQTKEDDMDDIYCIDCGYHTEWEDVTAHMAHKHRFVPLLVANELDIDVPDYDDEHNCENRTNH